MTVETAARVAFLKKIHLFAGLGDDGYERIADELDEMHVPKGEIIYEQGKKSEGFYLIYEGSVRIIRRENKKDIQLALLVKNDYFGEMGLLGKRIHSGTARADVDTLLFVLSRADFEKLYKSDPGLKLNMEVALNSRRLARQLNFDWLRKDEVVYFLARKHITLLYEKLVWPIFGFLVPIFFFYAWWKIVPYLIVALAGWVSLLAVILYIVWLVVDWGNDYYIVTNQRVVWLEKVVGIYDSRMESPIGTILSVGVEMNRLGRILDYGNVIVRTFVGKIPFNDVDHPAQAARMVEEYWLRSKEVAGTIEKEAMKNAIRRRLGIPLPPQPKPWYETPPPPPAKQVIKVAKPSRFDLIKLMGLDMLKLRYETGDHVIYRKHWVVLIFQAWISVLAILTLLGGLLYRLFDLAFDPNQALISFQNGLTIDVWASVCVIGLVPFLGWLIYEIADWSNDKYEVTAEQIIDLDKKPFGTETRNAAQLENILGTEYKRIGILGNLFNYGTVYITVGGSKLAFEDVMDPPAVQSDIDRRRMVRAAKKKEGEVAAERERMAEWIATYHKSISDFNPPKKDG